MKRSLYILIVSCLICILIFELKIIYSNAGSFSKKEVIEDEKDNENLVYKSDALKISMETIVRENPNVKMWITTVKVKDASQVKAAFAGDEFSLTKKESTSSIAKRNNAVLAINGDACGFNKDSLVIRNGKVYRNATIVNSLLFDNKGVLKFDNSKKLPEDLIKEGVMHSFLFAPPLIENGKMASWMKNEGVAPRTGIGQKKPFEYIILTVDGRSTASRGLTLYEMGQEFMRLGCYTAYNLDGGGSTTLYFNDEVINTPSDYTGERAISDILYFTE